jgi:hypothetical protein
MSEEEQKSVSALSKSKPNVEVSKDLEGICPLRWKVNKKGKIDLIQEENNQNLDILKEVFGTKETELAVDVLLKGVKSMPFGFNEMNFNVCTQMLADCKPKDAMEASLILQSNTLYSRGMYFIEKSANESTLPQAEFYMKNAIKLLRLHNETIEAITKYRRGGEQKLVVQHVNVNEGGRAVVGGIFEGGDGK